MSLFFNNDKGEKKLCDTEWPCVPLSLKSQTLRRHDHEGFVINGRVALTLLAKDLSRSTSLSQDLETGCLRLEVVKILGVQISKGDHNILILQP